METFYNQGKKDSCAHTSYSTFIEQKRGLLKKGRHCVTKVALDSENLYLNVITRQDKYLRFSYPIFQIQTVIGSTNVIIHIMKKDLLNNVHDDKKLKTMKNARFPECFK